jgi:hypothetical protein
MIFWAPEALKIDLAKRFIIRGRWPDVESGFDDGCHSIFINSSYEENSTGIRSFVSVILLAAAQRIEQLEQTNEARTGEPGGKDFRGWSRS